MWLVDFDIYIYFAQFVIRLKKQFKSVQTVDSMNEELIFDAENINCVYVFKTCDNFGRKSNNYAIQLHCSLCTKSTTVWLLK